MDRGLLRDRIMELIDRGVDVFYVGNQGQFDSAVYSCLKELRKEYPHICVCVVLSYLPTKKDEWIDMEDTVYPEIEGLPKFAIERRNRWMLSHSEYCICYVNRTWGGAYKFARLGRLQGKTVLSIGSVQL